jgi:hypothetical protein
MQEILTKIEERAGQDEIDWMGVVCGLWLLILSLRDWNKNPNTGEDAIRIFRAEVVGKIHLTIKDLPTRDLVSEIAKQVFKGSSPRIGVDEIRRVASVIEKGSGIMLPKPA